MPRYYRPYVFVILAGPALLLLSAVFRGPTPWSPAGPTPYTVSYPPYFGNRVNTTDDNPLTVEGIGLGRRLFYEKRLSAYNTISCGSCHRQTHAFADDRAFSLGFDQTPTRRNSMSLTNLLWVRHFFWDGRASSLEVQAITPMTDPHEMGQPLDSSAHKLAAIAGYAPLFSAAFGSDSITPDRIIKAITQFERTLISDNSSYDRYIRGEYKPTAAEQRGLALFYSDNGPNSAVGGGTLGVRGAGCGNCHSGPKVFSETYHNNGLDSVPPDSGRSAITGMNYDRGRFRVVTLRNIALTAPYMHDGRFKTLQEVIDHYSEHIRPSPTLSPSLKDTANSPVNLRLSGEEKADLLAFLRMLTDSAFITDPRFSDPFALAAIKTPSVAAIKNKINK
jgi:cytochrome c peroxidase